jgi:hypothetical protein
MFKWAWKGAEGPGGACDFWFRAVMQLITSFSVLFGSIGVKICEGLNPDLEVTMNKRIYQSNLWGHSI